MKKQLRRNTTLAALAVAALTSLGAHAADRATAREAQALFERAVDYMNQNGPERAFAAFNDRQGAFVMDGRTWHIDGIAEDDGHLITFYVVP